ncbi:uncharacterized protein [Diabrotica undecimpunctata]|uniref:uncharacterized protein isoform X2 n=1 Tax=Diabrotica undecimpunctata TaxID=50387 RepID=UPI003B636FC1
MAKMRVVGVIELILLVSLFEKVFGISNKEEVLLSEEFHRGAEDAKTTTSYDQAKTGTLNQNVYYAQQDGHRYGEDIPRTSYAVNEGGNLLYGQDAAANYGQYDHAAHMIPVYGYAPEVPYIYGAHAGHLPYNYGYGYGYGHPLGHSYGHAAEEVDHHYESTGFGVTGIGNYLKKKLTLKKIFIPLAGLALLAAVGTLSTSNPLLLQLGTISASTGRGRVRRSTDEEVSFPANPFLRANVSRNANKTRK